jgi:glycosyltransferase involved in cell wall biosynthesis
MRISLFLPHVGVFGGVRRFIELGNALAARGHEVVLFHPQGAPPAWLPFAGRTAPLAEASGAVADLALCADRHTLSAFLGSPAARRVYYCVIEKDPGVARALAAGAALAANSSPLRERLERRHGVRVIDGAGGLDAARFRPGPARRPAGRLRIVLNGRRSRPKKGTDLILAALRGLPWRGPGDAPEVILFDHVDPGEPDPREGARLPAGARYVLNPSQDELAALYQSAHVFVAAERKAGWCNTALEAMACGAAVACTRSGTTDFARHLQTALVVPLRHPWFVRRAVRRLIEDPALREHLAAAGAAEAPRWSWERLAEKLLTQIVADGPPVARA